MKSKKRKICVVTGTRSEFGLLSPVMDAIRAHPSLRLQVVAAGMHLLRRFGSTIREVQQRYRVAARVRLPRQDDSGASMAHGLACGIRGMTEALQRLKPDCVLVLGDRTEPFAAAIAALHLNIPLAHIHGGDRSRGGVDESVRHALTKLAQLHFAATKASARRIRRMGERARNLFVTGAPGLDRLFDADRADRAEVWRRLRLGRQAPPPLLVIQHPVTTRPREAGKQMKATLAGVRDCGRPVVLFYPNSDAGAGAVIRELERCRGREGYRIVRNLQRRVFVGLLWQAGVLVGNSSAGLIEAPALGLPVVNVGLRQDGRERGAGVTNVPHDGRRIGAAVRRQLARPFRRGRRKTPYGDGRAGLRIARILAAHPLDSALLQKQFVD